MKQEVIIVQNMRCSGCAGNVAQALGVFPEVKDVKVNLEDATVTISTEGEAERNKYEEALAKAGYPPQRSANPFHGVVNVVI